MIPIQRCAGILLHPTSLPSPYGIGDIGETAYAWLKLLHTNGITFWQMLPVGPVGYGNSPYQCLSACAGNPLLISPNLLKDDGLLCDEDLKQYPILPSKRVVYDAVAKAKEQLFRKAFDRFTETNDYSRFCIKEQAWLDDHALFDVLRCRYSGRPWNSWEPALAARDADALAAARSEYDYELRYRKFLQFVFFKQWKTLRTKAKKLGIAIMGDVPIYVAYDSADVWAYPKYFELDDLGNPIRVAGVPPDYFSATGQLWGNPLYKWDVMKQDGFAWWISRIRTALEISDCARLDHFRAFESYWAVSAQDATACNGTWVKGPGMELFKALRNALGTLPLIAEDLGDITPDVLKLKQITGFPGMAVMQFAFDGNKLNSHLPENVLPETIIYTGTHDNDTTQGWFNHLSAEDKKRVCTYLRCGESSVVDAMIRAACASVACACIIPLQDILGLDSKCRMNIPGTVGGNWVWRFTDSMLQHKIRRVSKFGDVVALNKRN